MKQIKLELENNPGEIAKISTKLGEVGINMESLFGKSLNDKGILHFVTDNPKTAEETLKKIGYNPEVTDMVIINLMNRPGELGKVTRELAHKKININSIYVLGEEQKNLKIALTTDNLSKTKKALKKYL